VLDPSSDKDNGSLIRHPYRKCLALSDSWLGGIKNTYADLFVAVLMVRFIIMPFLRASRADKE
jgi:hypothetical protein